MVNKKRFFTLIEILIVLSLLALFTGVIGINIRSALREQQFNTEVGLIVERLRLAQNLMLIIDRDIRFRAKLIPLGEGLEISLDAEGGIPKEWQFVIDRSKITLKAIHSLTFDDSLDYPKKPNEIEIRFLSGGTVMSRGVIHLSTHENRNDSGALNRAILLYGYPHPIESILEEKQIQLQNPGQEEDLRLTQFTMEELKK